MIELQLSLFKVFKPGKLVSSSVDGASEVEIFEKRARQSHARIKIARFQDGWKSTATFSTPSKGEHWKLQQCKAVFATREEAIIEGAFKLLKRLEGVSEERSCDAKGMVTIHRDIQRLRKWARELVA